MPLRDKLLAIAVVGVWGLNMIVIKLGVGEIPPLLMSALRFALVAALVLPFTRIKARDLPMLLLLSFTLGTMHFGFLFAALRDAEAGTSAVILQLGAPIATLLACLFLHEKLGAIRLVGLIVSVLGIAIIAAGPTLPATLPFALLLVSATGWAVSNLLVKHITDISPMAMMAWSALFSVPQLMFGSWIFEEADWPMLFEAGWHGWFCLAYSALGSSILGYGIWYWLLRRHPISAVVPYSMLNPLLSVLFGILLIGDDPSPVKIVGALVMVAGVALILRKPDVATLPDTA